MDMDLKNTSVTALALPDAVNAAVVPKPKKSEIIEALAIKKHAQLVQQSKEHQAKVEALEAQAIEAVRNWVKSTPMAALTDVSVNLGYVRHEDGDRAKPKVLYNMRISQDLDNPPAAVRKIVMAFHEATSLRVIAPDLYDVKRQIRDALNGPLSDSSQRVKRLLDDPKSSKALDVLLRQMDKAALK